MPIRKRWVSLPARPSGSTCPDRRAGTGKIVLKGNFHTPEAVLRGRGDDVVRTSRRAIDDAAARGGFILSTGDQCGRDAPDENLYAVVHRTRTYGKY